MSNVFQTCLKGFKLKKLVVEPKTTQLVEPDEEPVEGCKKPSLFHNGCSTGRGSIKGQSMSNGHLSNIKY